MKTITYYISVLLFCLSFVQCSDYLNVDSPSNADDEFVTSTVSETKKTLSWAYANYRQNCVFGSYGWNDPIGSDVEYYPEANSTNNANAKMKPEQIGIATYGSVTGFNNFYSVIARCAKIAKIISGKSEYQSAISSGEANDWTQLYGEAMTLRALCYFDLVKHFGDVPYGLENTYVTDYVLTSRFDIYDNIIVSLKEVEPLMYSLGENDITAERLSKSFANALIGMTALYSGGYQTIRTDVADLYGSVQFTKIGSEEYGCVYARRTDYTTYYTIAEQYFQAALDNKGSVGLITSDERSYANNPFQRHFQYLNNLEISPESFFELGIVQGSFSNGSSQVSQTNEFGYAFGRPSGGGSSNAAPPKVFGAIRIVPSFYYGGWEAGDKRRDASVVVTGSKGDGNEILIPFTPGSTTAGGGIAINKWDPNRMNPPYVTSQRQTGINWVILRMADLILMQAEVKAELDKSGEAIALVNQIRQRAFGNNSHDIGGISGDDLKEAIMKERKFELLGEGQIRWDLIRSGKLPEKIIAARAEMTAMISGLRTNGYYTFPNGNTISNYIYTKMVKLDNPLTYDADESNPALYPGWRGQYDYSTTSVAGKVVGTNHNMAIQGLFKYINPNGAEAAALVSDGYVKADWGTKLVANETAYADNMVSGIISTSTAPRYFWPIPYETISLSNGKITNGYGLPQQ